MTILPMPLQNFLQSPTVFQLHWHHTKKPVVTSALFPWRSLGSLYLCSLLCICPSPSPLLQPGTQAAWRHALHPWERCAVFSLFDKFPLLFVFLKTYQSMFSFLNSSFGFSLSLPACVTHAILPYLTMTFKDFKAKFFVNKRKRKRKSTLFLKSIILV